MAEDVKDVLNAIGYDRLTENGAYWRTNARYRAGDNRTSLRIHKRTGQFTDFVDKRFGTLDQLVKLTLQIGDVELKKFYDGNSIDIPNIIEKDVIPKLTMEKFWNESELTKLLPHYKFYEGRGISKETQSYFRGGLAHSGSMNERFVFPIYNHEGRIHGWTGRDMTGKKEAKWKHAGSKMQWVYPAFIPVMVKNTKGEVEMTFPVLEAIQKSREVILVESIGDMMALWERGHRNVLVTFGLVLSSKLGAFLMSLSVDRIIIALNNDFESEINRGYRAAVDMYIDLMHYVDFQKLVIALPVDCNDFGEGNDSNHATWLQTLDAPREKFILAALDRLRELYKAKKITAAQMKFGKILKDAHEQYQS